jgi:hypothetical protein
MIDRKGGLPSAKARAQSRVTRARSEETQQVVNRVAAARIHVSEDQLELYMLRGLDDQKRATVKKHLAACPDCRVDARETLQLFKEFREEVLPRSIARVMARGEQKLKTAAAK